MPAALVVKNMILTVVMELEIIDVLVETFDRLGVSMLVGVIKSEKERRMMLQLAGSRIEACLHCLKLPLIERKDKDRCCLPLWITKKHYH